MIRSRNLASLRALKTLPSKSCAEMMICSDESLIAADSLRSALADLQAAYALIQQLLDLAISATPTPNKDI